jgi:hypothetical protein
LVRANAVVQTDEQVQQGLNANTSVMANPNPNILDCGHCNELDARDAAQPVAARAAPAGRGAGRPCRPRACARAPAPGAKAGSWAAQGG